MTVSGSKHRCKLGELKLGQKAVITAVSLGSDPQLALRLMQMGFLEGAEVELARQAPISADPIAVRVRGALIALRRSDANHVEVEL